MKRHLLSAMLTVCMAVSLFSTGAYALTPAVEGSETYQSSSFYRDLCAVTLSGDWHTDIVNVALSQVGYHEGDCLEDYAGDSANGFGNFTEYARVFFGYNCEWCALFVSWCARQAEIPKYIINTAARAASDGAGGGTSYYFHLSTRKSAQYTPQVGDLVFFDRIGYGTQHVGLVAKLTDTGFYTVEGNCLNAVRIMYYDYDNPTVKYFGVYNQYGLETQGTVNDFAVTRLDFSCRDGARGTLPDSDRDLYSFQTLWAAHGSVFAMPAKAYVREDAELLGYAVQNCSDGKWLGADENWYDAEKISRGQKLYLVKDATAETVDGFWTEYEHFRLYAMWNVAGETVPDSSARACFEEDSQGWRNPYGDITEQDWYYAAFREAYRTGAYRGVAAAYPGESASRGEFVTMLYRLAGEPNVKNAEQPFGDVFCGDTVYDAAIWAFQKGIVKGMEDNAFRADGTLTREQAVTMLYRLSGANTSGKALSFADAGEVSDWAKDALAYASEIGWVQGIPVDGEALGCFPQQTMSRAQELTFAMRAAEMLKK